MSEERGKKGREERKQIQSNIVILIFIYINVCCSFFFQYDLIEKPKEKKYMETNSSEEKTQEQNETIREERKREEKKNQ